MGAYHTIDLELNKKFEITKPEWDSIDLERVEMACDVTKSADVAAIVMQEGIAHICLITSSMTIVRSKIDMAIPRKRKNHTGQHEKVRKIHFHNKLEFPTFISLLGINKILRNRPRWDRAPCKF